MILSFRTDKPEQTVQTQIRLLEEQSDRVLQSVPFRIHILDALLYGKATITFTGWFYGHFWSIKLVSHWATAVGG